MLDHPAVDNPDMSLSKLNSPNILKSRKGLGFLHLNIRSLLQHNKLDHVKILVSQADPDVLVLTESWLKSSTHDSMVAINDYNLFRIDRTTRGGGVAVYVKSHYSVTLLHAVSVRSCFEFIALELSLSSNDCFVVIGVYRPPSAVNSTLTKLAHLISPYVNREVIVMGDFNIDWLSGASEPFKEICSNLNLTQIITEPTRPNLKNPVKSTLIDLILSNQINKIVSAGVFDLGISDHCPVACIRSIHLKKSQPKIIIKRNFKGFNNQAFLNELYQSDIHLTSEISDVELALEFFTNTFSSILNKHAPLKKHRVKNRSNP